VLAENRAVWEQFCKKPRLEVGSLSWYRLMVLVPHNAANEYLGLIERVENGAPRACANWTAPSSGQ
jgi:hypothetical protein